MTRTLFFPWICLLWLPVSQGANPTDLSFIENRGQLDASVRYMAKDRHMAVSFEQSEIVLRIADSVVTLGFAGANPGCRIEARRPQSGPIHFLIGAVPDPNPEDVPSFGEIIYRELYPGIDLSYGSENGRLKSEFHVRSGADPGSIRLQYEGAERVEIDALGALVLHTAAGILREEAPETYQIAHGRREPVASRFRIQIDGAVTFDVGAYDRERTLIIDPVLTASTYLGGSGFENATAVAVDSTGYIYVAGWTDSSDLRTVNALRPTSGGGVDAFVAKFSPDGKTLIYCTYLGGNGDDRAFGLAVDSAGNAYVTGWTYSTNFPFAQNSYSGGRDAFIAKLNASGSAVAFSAYLGGSGADSGNAIAVDAAGNAYITGDTTSTNLPVLNAFQTVSRGQSEVFVAKFGPLGTLLYSTYIGGAGDDFGRSIAVDGAGNAYVTGSTTSTNFPTMNAFQQTSGGNQDVFVAKLNTYGTALVYSTYLGGSGGTLGSPEYGTGIAVDVSGAAYVTGVTSSANFPLMAPLRSTFGGGVDAFVAKLNASGNGLAYSTYLGGSSLDYGQAIGVDPAGNVYVAGYTASTDFPVVGALQGTNAGRYDGFIAQISPGGGLLVQSTYLGGSGSDAIYGLAVRNGGIYVAGQTQSTDFPLQNAVQTLIGGAMDGFMVWPTMSASAHAIPALISVTPASGIGFSQVFSVVYDEAAGAADFLSMQVIINGTLSGVNGCYFGYDKPSNRFLLLKNDGSGWMPGGPLVGSTATISNAQCTLSGSGSSVSWTDTRLTVSYNMTFSLSFAGPKTIWTNAYSVTGLSSPYASSVGAIAFSWVVPSSLHAIPVLTAFSPTSGSGLSQVFAVTFDHAAGPVDFLATQIIIIGASTVNSCYFGYDKPGNRFVLLRDDAGGWIATGVTVGSTGTVANSQCTLYGSGSSVSWSGSRITTTYNIGFNTSFAGNKTIWTNAYSVTGQGSPYVSSIGATPLTWTVPGAIHAIPVLTAFSPASGSGLSQIFSVTYDNAAGPGDFLATQIIITGVPGVANACYFGYDKPSNRFLLLKDDGSTWIASGVAPDSNEVLANSQCTLFGNGSSVSWNGSHMITTYNIVFKASFAGSKAIWTNAFNVAGQGSPYASSIGGTPLSWTVR
jgi:hypothetical protein